VLLSRHSITGGGVRYRCPVSSPFRDRRASRSTRIPTAGGGTGTMGAYPLGPLHRTESPGLPVVNLGESLSGDLPSVALNQIQVG
jgi:hypothetical protein